MNRIILVALSLIALVSFAGLSLAQEPVTLRFLCFQDRNECDVYADLLARFTEANPEIAVSVDVVDEAEILEQQSALFDASAGYDIARVNRLSRDFLDLRPYLDEDLEASYRPVYFEALRTDGDKEQRYGFPDALATIAPFVNTSLFAQAGVELPDLDASWDDWLVALDQVVAATDAAYLLSVDNKDHRLVGPAMSMGAQYFDEDGSLTLPDAAGLRDFLQILHRLMDEGKTPADTLLGTGKSQEYFVRGETLMYICGSWKVEEVAAQVGDDFEWAIVSNPSGSARGTGVAQATWLVALGHTDQPEAVGQIFEYLLQPDVSAEFTARTLTIPPREYPLNYQHDNEVVTAALNQFAVEATYLQFQAIALDLHPLAPVYHEASNTNLRAYFAGELTLDEALDNLRSALADANAALAS